jgi:cytochrome c553
MKVVCAWCHKTLKEYESQRNMVSHGICPDCLRELIGGTDVNLRDFLDKLDFPVLLTDGTALVQRANRMADVVFGQSTTRMLTNVAIGMAIECLNAQGTGQCGRAEHCAGCVLRETILATHGDGQPRYGMYSQNEVTTALGARPKRFRFSTTRIGDAVMLSVEEILDLAAAS